MLLNQIAIAPGKSVAPIVTTPVSKFAFQISESDLIANQQKTIEFTKMPKTL